MDKYLTLFNTNQEYNNYKNSSNFATPNVSYCEQESEVYYNPIHDYSKDYFTIESLEDNNTIYLKASKTSATKTISVSTDNGETWQEYTSTDTGSGTTLTTLNNGDKLLIKGQNETYGNLSYYNQFISTGQFEAKGNIMSLISGDSFTNADELTTSYTFYCLFSSCSGLISVENLVLPATTLADSCYSYMFADCTSLTTAPELLATTLADHCYMFMFRNCRSLTTAPELPATTLADNCYRNMFERCTSLTTAPELSSTTLANECYAGMFGNCTSLITAPELPATTIVSNCYANMFYGCTSLTTAPELPATTLEKYCYWNMFNSCTNLNYIKAMFTTTPGDSSPNYYTLNWVKGVASTGTFVKNSAATWNVTGVSGIPTGWTVQTASA